MRRRNLWHVLCVLLLSGCGTSAATTVTGVSAHRVARAQTSPAIHHSQKPKTFRPIQLGPVSSLEKYWHSIDAHRFATAYGYLASGITSQSQSQFVADEEHAGILSVSFHGQATSSDGSAATVNVTHLTTDDAQFGCRTWTGAYELARRGARWVIERADIKPAPCITGGSTSPSAVPASPPSTSTPTAPSTTVEGPGSFSHATDVGFCTTHQCIPNFPNGNGYIVQCVDGEWSHSGGLSGACSDHGGER
jgi:hypothetical protein